LFTGKPFLGKPLIKSIKRMMAGRKGARGRSLLGSKWASRAPFQRRQRRFSDL